MSSLAVVVGGQFGSEAKGAVTAWLTRNSLAAERMPVVIRVAGPNAGHTAYDKEGVAWALRQVPVGMVVSRDVIGIIANGSEVDLPVLLDEVRQLDAAGLEVSRRLYVSGKATLLTDEHHEREANLDMHKAIGSTAKGIGAARADRIMRTAPLVEDIQDMGLDEILGLYYDHAEDDFVGLSGLKIVDDATAILQQYRTDRTDYIIEGTQGYGLGLHGDHYPKCTSSDTRAIDFCAMAGINPWDWYITQFDIWMVCRAFPIRVAGDSGHLERETTWDALGLPVELTTVTKKPRRVGLWDQSLFRDALRANGIKAVTVAYSMADQEFPDMAGLQMSETMAEMERMYPAEMAIINSRTNNQVGYIGTGPNSGIEILK